MVRLEEYRERFDTLRDDRKLVSRIYDTVEKVREGTVSRRNLMGESDDNGTKFYSVGGHYVKDIGNIDVGILVNGTKKSRRRFIVSAAAISLINEVYGEWKIVKTPRIFGILEKHPPEEGSINIFENFGRLIETRTPRELRQDLIHDNHMCFEISGNENEVFACDFDSIGSSVNKKYWDRYMDLRRYFNYNIDAFTLER